jgi:hypothetical protein
VSGGVCGATRALRGDRSFISAALTSALAPQDTREEDAQVLFTEYISPHAQEHRQLLLVGNEESIVLFFHA